MVTVNFPPKGLDRMPTKHRDQAKMVKLERQFDALARTSEGREAAAWTTAVQAAMHLESVRELLANLCAARDDFPSYSCEATILGLAYRLADANY